jgi:uncharacterized protein YggU (UPF0235/DUF167 family)
VTVDRDIAAAIGDHPRGSTLSLTVTPRSSQNRLDLQPDGALRARITAPPVEGAANAALLKLLAAALEIPRSRLAIASGDSSRRKRIIVDGIAPADLTARLRQSLQQ